MVKDHLDSRIPWPMLSVFDPQESRDRDCPTRHQTSVLRRAARTAHHPSFYAGCGAG